MAITAEITDIKQTPQEDTAQIVVTVSVYDSDDPNKTPIDTFNRIFDLKSFQNKHKTQAEQDAAVDEMLSNGVEWAKKQTEKTAELAKRWIGRTVTAKDVVEDAPAQR